MRFPPAIIQLRRAQAVARVEHDCYDTCGFAVADRAELEYAIRTSNWKALTLGAQWMYVVPVDSHLEDYAPHWRWVRAELGRTAADAFDGWVVLREAQAGAAARWWLASSLRAAAVA